MKYLLGILFLGYLSLLRAQDTLLLFHPTAYNLELFNTLSSSGLLDLDGYHVLGVYHEREAYDYEKSREFLSREGSKGYSIVALPGPLHEDSLFCSNSCSAAFRALFSASRAAFFMGGPDIPPAAYGQKLNLLTAVTDPFRHYLELSYLFHLLGGSKDPEWIPFMEQQPDYLVNGICLGMQGMNVASGGTLVQDIPTLVYGIRNVEDLLVLPENQLHRNYHDRMVQSCTKPTSYHFHRIRIKEGSFLDLAEPGSWGEPMVLSSHHQAVGRLGTGWEIAAASMDGKIIEAIGHAQYPHVFGVQFHPEKPGLFNPDIVHLRTCGDSISFHQTLSTCSASEAFHRAYWEHLGRILQLIRLR